MGWPVDDPDKPWRSDDPSPSIADLLHDVDVLPQAQLEQLVKTGHLVSVTSFADHMRPDVHWIEPEEYRRAFDEIAGADDMTGKEVAFTSTAPSYPGYINATLGLDEVVITVRGDPKVGQVDPADPLKPVECGVLAQVRIPFDEWDQFVASAQQLRAGSGT